MSVPRTTSAKGEPVLSVRDLTVTFTGAGRPAPAVRGISFDVYPGEVLGIVGESGSGKSVACLAVAGLLPDNAQVTGSIRLVGTEVVSADAETLRTLRGRDVGFVFQDPTTTLNPVLPVGRQIVEGRSPWGVSQRATRGRAPWQPCARSRSRPPKRASSNIRTSSPGACASAPSSPWRCRGNRS